MRPRTKKSSDTKAQIESERQILERALWGFAF